MRDLSLPTVGGDLVTTRGVVTSNGQQRREAATALAAEAVRILICDPGNQGKLRAYGQYLCDRLDGRLGYRQLTAKEPLGDFLQAATRHDLLLFGEPAQTLLARLVFGSLGPRVASRSAATVLLAREPRWPIRELLLALRVEPSELSAVRWAGRLASACKARLTILPIVPPQPLMIGAGSRLRVGLDALLAPETPSGQQLRDLLAELGRWQVDGTLRVRQGEPLWQICWEIEAGDYDLVIIGADTGGRLKRLLFGELVRPLLERIQRPAMVVAAELSAARQRRAVDVQ